MSDAHPMTDLLKQYIDDFESMKRDHEDLDGVRFNKQCGLTIVPPSTWPVYEAIASSAHYGSMKGLTNFVVVYSSTEVYNRASESLNNVDIDGRKVQYFTWHEFYSAMSRVSEDVSYLRRLKDILSSADVVFFLGASTAIQQAVDQVCGAVTGCLITIG